MNKDDIIMEDMIKDANNYGFDVKNYDELKAIKRKIKNFIPRLIEYLDIFQTRNFKRAVIWLLAVKGFSEATEALLDAYFSDDISIDKWAIGDALYSIQDKRFEDEYIKIVSDKGNGDSRQMIVILLGKLRCEKAITTLISLLKDDEVNGHAIIALGYFKDINLIKYIEPFLNHEKRWIKKEAEKSIKKLKTNKF